MSKSALLIFLSLSLPLAAQNIFGGAKVPQAEDTLKGSNTKFRDFWDVKKYDITVEPVFETKTVKGSNTITFEIVKDISKPVFQIDLQQPMQFRISGSDEKLCTAKREGDFIFIHTNKDYRKGEKHSFTIDFWGNPIVAKNAPWDGGWIFDRDDSGNPWMTVAQQGITASVWLPNKDIWSDEPDNGISMTIATPKDLVGVGNGRLISRKTDKDKNFFTWEVKNPINVYSIVPTVGKLANFKDSYAGEKGKLDLDYWVLEENLDKAKEHFKLVKPMMEAFEYWFGPYPFYEDSFKLVETPHLGMEHQSNVAYGNKYQNGYLGNDLSETGVGLKWDFIIIHESGHEWFANNITAKDKADMWIHEGFTSYSETLFTEKFLDKKSAEAYVQGTRKNIENDIPLIGQYGIRKSGSTDMYYKGANTIHTIRQVINNDEKFRQILRGLNKEFYHKTVTTQEVENYISKHSEIEFSKVFDQYLRTTKIPVLEYTQNGNQLKFRYSNTIENFRMPLRLKSSDFELKPTQSWQTVTLKDSSPVQFDSNYYIEYEKL